MSPLVRLIMHRLASGRVRPTPEVLAALRMLNARSLNPTVKKGSLAGSQKRNRMKREPIALWTLKIRDPADGRHREFGNVVEFRQWTAKLASGCRRELIHLK